MTPIHIKVVDGDTVIFEGRQIHWANCFFSNAYERNIRNFCQHHNWSVKIRNLCKAEIMVLEVHEKQFLRELEARQNPL